MMNRRMQITRPTRARHLVLALTVAAYMITYMDRVVISAAVPSIQHEFGFSIVTMGWVLGSFRWGYSLFQIPGGWLGDKLGARRALTWIVVWWSVFCSATAGMWNASTMIACRFLFGVGEAGAFPIATRSLSRWMLPSERGFAQGITHAGSRLGAALTPPIVTWILVRYGWRAAFVSFGSLGLIWAAVWHWYYRDTPAEHSGVNAAELELISEKVAVKKAAPSAVPWKLILGSSQMWILSAMYFCYSYSLAVYLDWFPKYLNAERGFSIGKMGLYASLPLFAGTVGDICGGWASDRLTHRMGLCAARRIVAISGFLLAAASILAACLVSDSVESVGYSCLAMFGLELTVGVAWAIPLDIGGDFAGSVSAVMNTLGNVGGAIATTLSSYLVKYYGWSATFIVMSVLSVLAALLFTRIDAGKKIV
jgi:sugar phosphate permease